ncbi:RNA polymerase ECF-type sigma factor [Arcticibacter svalbardensis MN12-7]|uniref:RNA polymerase ECF-type sigma factor n=1 Tax=Arcticibacter svalbardensis MN12-7 TaxID=1150600 RepID=R9GV94_9SPHI|nr:RNA polymerase sigma-70 factor [Arcticibacter svalbardensis]EOR95757.1 RNA polymerase ECF-type sigma factor [Arcticibacter svalbardensis MN12-7]
MSLTLENLPDHLLLEHCRAGTEAAFNVLFRRYFNKLYQFSLKFLKDEVIAESLVLDLLLQLWQKSDQLDNSIEIAPYLFTAMKNKVLNHVRKNYLKTLPLDDVENHCLTAISADGELEARELASVYQSMVKKLSPQRRKVFQMSREQDMTHKEIAAELQLSVNTVENHISASIRFLRQNLKDHTDIAFVLACYLYI